MTTRKAKTQPMFNIEHYVPIQKFRDLQRKYGQTLEELLILKGALPPEIKPYFNTEEKGKVVSMFK